MHRKEKIKMGLKRLSARFLVRGNRRLLEINMGQGQGFIVLTQKEVQRKLRKERIK